MKSSACIMKGGPTQADDFKCWASYLIPIYYKLMFLSGEHPLILLGDDCKDVSRILNKKAVEVSYLMSHLKIF